MSFTDEFDICVQKAQEYLCFIEKIFSSGDEKFSDIINRNLQNSKKIFCKKSTLPLGYFDPCPVEDLIVGKSNRGKLSDKMPSSESLITYYFDNDILKMAEDGIYYYIYDYSEADKKYIYAVPKNRKLNLTYFLTVCEYENGKIRKLTRFTANSAELPGGIFNLLGANMILIKGMNDKQYMFDLTEKIYTYSDEHIELLEIMKVGSYGKKRSAAEYRFNYKGDYYSSYSSNKTQYRIKEKRMYNEFYNM